METSLSLLDSLQTASGEVAWRRLVELYSPLIRGWLRRYGAAPRDVEDDVVQDVLTVVVRRFPEFRRQRTGSFRSWLRTITANCLRDQWRRKSRQPSVVGGSEFGEMVAGLEDPHSGISALWNEEHDLHVLRFLLEKIRGSFSETTWQAFQQFAIDGSSADRVAQELNITANAVFIAKSRVLASLRLQAQGLLELK